MRSLRARMQAPLPGEKAHQRVAPFERPSASEVLAQQIPVRHSAVLLLIYPKQGHSHFVLIKRPEYDGAHSGQIALPGGKHEEGESLSDTALRETFEEVGVPMDAVDIVGEMTSVYVPPSNFIITPFIGEMRSEPRFVPDEREVEFILEVPVGKLLPEEVIKRKEITVGLNEAEDISFETPYFDLQGQTVWGATAAVVSELRDVLLDTLNDAG